MPGNRGLAQAYVARDTVAQAIAHLRSLNGNLSTDQALALAKLVDAFDLASERIRIIRGRPLPGTLQPSRMKKAKPVPKQRHRDVEPVDLPTPPASTEPDKPSDKPEPDAGPELTDYPG